MSVAKGAGVSTETTRTSAVTRVVVGVDGWVRNLSALGWAVQDAVARGVPLHLVAAAPADGESRAVAFAQHETDDLLRLVRTRAVDLGADPRTVTTESRVGGRTHELLASRRDGDLVVVGRRPLGAVPRTVLGSTSTALATLSPGPVVIVPDGLGVGTGATHVVAGCDGTARDDGVLDLALDEAEHRGLGVVAVSALDPAPLLGLSQAQEQEAAGTMTLRLRERVSRRSAEHPDVPVQCLVAVRPAADAIERASATPALLVVGRSAVPRALVPGLSVVRRLIDRLRCPLAIVPVVADAAAWTPDEEDLPQA
jgi:nucleotide-binding universal stress UspA family protein